MTADLSEPLPGDGDDISSAGGEGEELGDLDLGEGGTGDLSGAGEGGNEGTADEDLEADLVLTESGDGLSRGGIDVGVMERGFGVNGGDRDLDGECAGEPWYTVGGGDGEWYEAAGVGIGEGSADASRVEGGEEEDSR